MKYISMDEADWVYNMCDYVSYYFNADKNVFIDESGYEMRNIFSIISPNMMYLFKKKKEDMFVYGLSGEFIELIYPYAEDHL